MTGFKNWNNLFKRIVCAKTIGFALSVIGFVWIWLMGYELSTPMLIGALLWYPAMGFVVGLMGVITHHPIFGFAFGTWRGGVIVGIMNVIASLFAYEVIVSMGATMGYTLTPWCVVGISFLEGLVVGWLMDFVVTKKYGQGASLLQNPQTH